MPVKKHENENYRAQSERQNYWRQALIGIMMDRKSENGKKVCDSYGQIEGKVK